MWETITTAFSWAKGFTQVMDIWSWLMVASPLGLFFKAVRRFATRPPGSYIVLVCVALAAGYFFGLYKYHEGFSAAKQEYETKIEAERERLAEEKRLAEEDAARRIEELENEAERRDELLNEVTRNASGRTGRGISSDSVRDLNRVD